MTLGEYTDCEACCGTGYREVFADDESHPEGQYPVKEIPCFCWIGELIRRNEPLSVISTIDDDKQVTRVAQAGLQRESEHAHTLVHLLNKEAAMSSTSSVLTLTAVENTLMTYSNPVQVKPRSKRGQRVRRWPHE